VHQHGLGLIVGIVTDRDGLAPASRRHVSKKRIASPASSLFYGQLLFFGQRSNVDALDSTGKPPGAGYRGYKLSVTIGLCPTK
jgi:hypothetical protein